MRAGALRHLVTVQQPGAEVSDGEGGYTVSGWSTFAAVYAAIAPADATNRERVFAASVQMRVSHLVTIRYQPGITTKMRLLFGPRILKIAGIQNPDERNISLVLACEEQPGE